MKLKVATVCTGIGSPEQALKNLDIEHEIVFGCEIDRYAKKTYLANFNPGFMEADMTKCDWEGEQYYADLFVGGIPCQSFSLAGKRLGEADPRGLLFYDFWKYVKNQQPKYFIIENVKGLLSDDNGKTFKNWLHLLGRSENTHINMFNHPDSLEYNLHWTVLNTKDFGLPQNRERVFLVGIRQDMPNTFRFPIGWRLDKRLKDVLEENVDEKYYLSEKLIKGFENHAKRHNSKGTGFAWSPKSKNDIASTIRANAALCATDNTIIEPICAAMRGRDPDNPSARITGQKNEQRLEVNSQGTTNTLTSVQKDNLIIEPTYNYPRVKHQLTGSKWDKTHEQNGRVYDENGIAPTIHTMGGGNQEPKTFEGSRIRRLTPLECFRLQGFPDDFFHRAKEVNSDTQLYKQAGNTISVPVIQAILKNLLTLKTCPSKG